MTIRLWELMDVENQVAPFRIPTKDGERLFAWLIAPLGLYSKYADGFIKEESGVDGIIEQRLVLNLLRDDPEARLLIYCNAKPLHLCSLLTTDPSSWCKFQFITLIVNANSLEHWDCCPRTAHGGVSHVFLGCV